MGIVHVLAIVPIVQGMEPGELDTNLVYRIFISSKQGTGQHDFKINNSPTQPADTNSP